MVEVKIYSCYKLTYSAIYKDVLKRIYGSSFDCNNVVLTIEDVSENEIYNLKEVLLRLHKELYESLKMESLSILLG